MKKPYISVIGCGVISPTASIRIFLKMPFMQFSLIDEPLHIIHRDVSSSEILQLSFLHEKNFSISFFTSSLKVTVLDV